jgi:outer membrane protein, multidrug efflux system
MKTISSLLSLAFLLPVALAATPAAAPLLSTPATFRDLPGADTPAGGELVWRPAEPADASERGAWWTVFSDPTLDELVGRSLAANQDLRAAAARVEQARAGAGLARSAFWPQLAAGGSVTRERTSATTEIAFPDTLTTLYRAPLSVAWEIDLFGRVRHLTASARAEAAASTAHFESVRLALTAEVASTYFSIRELERERELLQEAVRLRRRAREIAGSRFSNGTATELDVARADTELATTEAEIAELANRRAAQQNALAVLLGAAAPDFALPLASGVEVALPSVPVGLPATLLERRPDIAAAERALAAANERIGVAKAAFFPAISLTGAAGFASGDVDQLFRADSRIWSFGPSLYLPIFQGGRNRANLQRSRAGHDEAEAALRQSVLVALREVQDSLTASRFLAEQAAAEQRALVAARRAAALAQTRYEAGLVPFLDVIDAQRTTLGLERRAAQLSLLRVTNAVTLIKALGGGWHHPREVATR